mgnify:FL=1
MSCLAVIDTNILVSALLSKHADSATVKVIEKLFDGEIIPVYSNEITNEYREVLHRKKFKFDCILLIILYLQLKNLEFSQLLLHLT